VKTEDLKQWLVEHESAIHIATMNIRYALDGFSPVPAKDVSALRRSVDAFVKMAERIQAQQEAEEKAEEALRDS
jgi:hypothetical protein